MIHEAPVATVVTSGIVAARPADRQAGGLDSGIPWDVTWPEANS